VLGTVKLDLRRVRALALEKTQTTVSS
jgi:hypothetical protein